MDKGFFEVKGFEKLATKIKKLGNDKDKRKQVNAILRKSAASTIKVARGLAPKDKQIGAKAISYKVMARARVPMGVVRVGKYKGVDAFYMRSFVIPGHNIYKGGFKRNRRGNQKANAKGAKTRVDPTPFMAEAQRITQNLVQATAIPLMEKFIQKRINQL